MTKDEAIKAAELALNRNRDLSETGRLVVINHLSIERPYGWVFTVSTEEFLMTKNRRLNVLGGPIVFRVSDGSITELHSGIPTEQAIAEFEKRAGL